MPQKIRLWLHTNESFTNLDFFLVSDIFFVRRKNKTKKKPKGAKSFWNIYISRFGRLFAKGSKTAQPNRMKFLQKIDLTKCYVYLVPFYWFVF